MSDPSSPERAPGRTPFDEWPHEYRPGAGSLLLALHGTGGDERQILGLVDELDPGAAALAPRGRVLESGMTRWFRRRAEGVFVVEDVIARAGELAAFVGDAAERYGLAGRPITAVGFSNGANVGTALGILHPDVAPRVVAFSGMYPLGDAPIPTDLMGSRFLLLGGADDPMAPAASVDRLEAELTRAGADVVRRRRPGGHGITADELDAARVFLRSAA